MYAAMAEQAGQQPSGEASSQSVVATSLTTGTSASATGTGIPAATTSDDGCLESKCQMPSGSDYSHREMPQLEFVVLAVLGVVYLVQAILP